MAPGSARTVTLPGPESDQSVMVGPVDVLIPPPNPFHSYAGWSFLSFRERFQSLSVSGSENNRLGTPRSARH